MMTLKVVQYDLMRRLAKAIGHGQLASTPAVDLMANEQSARRQCSLQIANVLQRGKKMADVKGGEK